MANVTANVSTVDVTVTSTPANITVTDVDSNVSLSAISTSVVNVSVDANQLQVNVAPLLSVSNTQIRAAVSAVDAGGDGSFTYDEPTGVFTYTGPNQTEANARIANASQQVRAHIGNTDPVLYDSSTGIISLNNTTLLSGQTTDNLVEGSTNLYLNGAGTTDDLTEGTSNLYFTNARVLAGIVDGNVKLKEFSETVAADSGNIFGNVTFDVSAGTIHSGTLTGNIHSISFSNFTAGSSMSIVLTQNAVGGFIIDTGGLFSSYWNDWEFANDETIPQPDPNTSSLLTVTYDGTKHRASLVRFDTPLNTVTVNGTTIALGDSGNISHFGDLTTDSLPEGSVNEYLSVSNLEDILGDNAGLVNVDVTFGKVVKAGENIDNIRLTHTNAGVFLSRASGFGASGTDLVYAIQAEDGRAISGIGWSQSEGRLYQYFDNRNPGPPFSGAVPDPVILPINSDELTEGNTNLYFTDTRLTNYFGDNGNFPFAFNGDLTIAGNVEVSGNLDYVNVVDLLVNDQSITLNYGNATARDAFIYVDRSGSALSNAYLQWNESLDAWQYNDGTTTRFFPTTTELLPENVNLYYTEARANGAIDARVTKSFVDALGIEYSSLTNLPTIPTHTSNLINDSGFITSATANVISVNGQTGVVVLDTDDVSEGTTNKYFANSLARAAVSASGDLSYNVSTGVFSVTTYKTADFNTDFATKTTSDLTEGSNLYYTSGRANAAIDAYVSGGNAITVASGVVSLDNTAVTPGTYGNATTVAQVTVDQQGRLTGVTDVPISGLAQANSFGIISVSGQANVEADVATDQVTFVAGTGVTITTDAGTDSITFNSTGGYGNVDVQNFLENGYSAANINANDIVAVTFTGDGSDLTSVRAETIEVTIKNADTVQIDKGMPVHAIGTSVGGEIEVVLADAGNASLMPAHFIANETLASTGDTGRGILSGRIFGVDTSSFTVGDTIFVGVGGGYANVAPSGEANLIQNLGVVTDVAVSGAGEVYGAGRAAATPNLDQGNIFIGDATNKAVSIDLDNFTYAISSSADISTTANVDAEVVNTRRQVYTFPSSTDKNFVDLDNYDTPGAANIILISGKFSVNHLFDTQGLGADTWAVKSGNANVAVANTWIKVSGNGVTEFYGEPTRAQGTFIANGDNTGFQVTNNSQLNGTLTVNGNSTFNGVDNDLYNNIYNISEWNSSLSGTANYFKTEIRKYDANLIASANSFTMPSVDVVRYGGTESSATAFGDSNVAGRFVGALNKPSTLQLDHPIYGWINFDTTPKPEYTSGIVFEAGEDTGQYTGPTFLSSGFNFRYRKNVSQGVIKFRTLNLTNASSTDAEGIVDGSWFNGALNKANATVMYIDNQVHIGREDTGTSFSFPTSAGSTNQFLALDANSDLQWTSTLNNVTLGQFQETKVDLGSVSGDQSSALDASGGSIYTLTATGGITINSLANAVAGTSMTIIITQDGTGSHALTSSMKFAGADKTLSTAPGSIDIISVFYDGTNYYASLTKGYA